MYNHSMGAEVIPKLTYEEFRQFPDDGKHYELIHGEVHLSPSRSTKHQLILGNTSASLGTYVKSARLGVLFSAPLDVCLNPDTALQPDLIFHLRRTGRDSSREFRCRRARPRSRSPIAVYRCV